MMKLKTIPARFALVVVAALGLCGQASAGQVTYVGGTDPVSVSYYDANNFLDTGSSIAFGTSYLTDNISKISELRDLGGSDTDPNWPDASIVFGADFTATIDVSASGFYTFHFGTDDAGYLFINGNLIANQGGIHAIDIQPYKVFLAAGQYSLEVQYDNILCCGAVAYLGLPGSVPEPGTLALLGAGLLGLAGFASFSARTRRKAAAA